MALFLSLKPAAVVTRVHACEFLVLLDILALSCLLAPSHPFLPVYFYSFRAVLSGLVVEARYCSSPKESHRRRNRSS